jgi:hypothetical protein
MGYIRGGSDYSMIQSQAAMLKLMHENERKHKELLKRALSVIGKITPVEYWWYGSDIPALVDEIKKAIEL